MIRFLFQFLLILAISFLGELIHRFVPLPIPASVYGMVLLFLALLTRLVKVSQVKEAGNFLLAIMPVLFIPAGVGLMASWGILKPVLGPVGLITIVSLVTVFGATGLVAQYLIGRKGRRNG